MKKAKTNLSVVHQEMAQHHFIDNMVQSWFVLWNVRNDGLQNQQEM